MNNTSFDDMETVKLSTSENDFVVITEDFLVSGMTSGCGINKDQFKILGLEYPAPKGWKQSLIGKRISKETAEKFIALKGVHKPKDRSSILSQETNGTKPLKKTESINLTHRESIILYQLVKNEYCNIVAALGNTEESKPVKKIYNTIMDKLEGAIAKTID